MSNADPDEDEFEQAPDAVLRAFTEVLAAHTQTPSDARLCVWEHYGYPWGGSPWSIAFYTFNGQDPGPWPWPILPSTVRLGLKATIAGMDRNFIVLSGTVFAAAEFGWKVRGSWFERKWPDVVFPADRSWLVYSDVDEDTVDVFGSAALIDALRSVDGLTAITEL